MNACILAIGSEMLTPFRVDTNSLFITERLNAIGYDVRLKAVVADDVDELARVIGGALAWADVIVITGGLGPTEDDITRDAVARVLELPLDVDEGIVERLRDRFARRGMAMPEINRRQAMVPRGATVLPNANGTAPGLWLEQGKTAIVLLPGPPREMKPMFERVAASVLSPRAGRERFYRVSILVAGRSESHVEEAIQPIYAPLATAVPPIETTILAAPGQIEVHLTALSGDAELAHRSLASARDRIVTAIGDDAFSADGRSMEDIVGGLLRDAGSTIAVAESCSGGLLLSRLTDIPGSSAYVRGGVVAYSNDVKTAFADVPAALIAEHGAVSEPVATAMAEGIRQRMDATVGVGVTGIAGPGGGTPTKPVGTVAIAVAAPSGTTVRTVRFNGSRAQIKHYASQSALDMVRRTIARDAAGRRG